MGPVMSEKPAADRQPLLPPAPAADVYATGIAVAQGEWTTGCMDCLDDTNSCCCTFWCPCVVVGRIAEIVTEGHTDAKTGCCLWFWLQALSANALPAGLGCFYSHTFRSKLRQKYGLPADPCPDYVLHFFCLGCALCQEYRELQNRGWDPSRNYWENLAMIPTLTEAPQAQAMQH